MDATKPLIEPQNIPMWVIAAFVVATVALMLSLGAVYRTQVVLAGTKIQVLALNDKIEKLKAVQAPAAVAAAPVADGGKK
jgi:hypothetical protein